MKKFLSALLLVSSLSSAEELKRPVSIGFGAGPTYGAGFIFRYEWEKWGLQGSILPVYTSTGALFVEGITGFYTLNRGKYGRLYLSGGVAQYNRMRQTIEYEVKTSDENQTVTDMITTKKWDSGFAVGPGVGFQFDFADNFALSFDLPVAIVFDTTVKLHFDAIRPYPNVAILYNF